MTRFFPIMGMTITGAILFSPVAEAGMRVTAKTASYSISGKTGIDLMLQMDRKGPKHGFLARAIAQTRYRVTWDIAWEATGGRCRAKDVAAKVDLTYTYPSVTSSMSPALNRQWTAFKKGVRKHEEMHGVIARRMVIEAEKSVSRISVANDRSCRRAKQEANRVVKAAYAKYEAQQLAFDEKEHREGGTVDRLVVALIQ